MLASLIGPVTGLLDKVIEDKDQKAALAHGGWRPFIGWVCGFAFAYHFVLQPLIVFGVTAAGVDMPELPSFDMGSLLTVMMGMLGLGGLRSVEKLKKIEK